MISRTLLHAAAALLISCTGFLGIADGGANPPPASLRDAKEAAPGSGPAGAAADADGLRLLPKVEANDSEISKSLADARWVKRSLKNILGAGSDVILEFHQDDNGKLSVQRTIRTYRSVNDKGPRVEDKTETLDAAVAGPILRIGELRQTFVVVPGKELVLRALVPLGDGKWYFTASQVWYKAGQHDVEMLIDFADDPLTKDQGTGTIQQYDSHGDHVLKEAVQFSLKEKQKWGRNVEVLAAGNGSRRVQILFTPGGLYGRVLDQVDGNSEVFSAEGAK